MARWILTAEVEAESENDAGSAFISLVPFLLVNRGEIGDECEGVSIRLQKSEEES